MNITSMGVKTVLERALKETLDNMGISDEDETEQAVLMKTSKQNSGVFQADSPLVLFAEISKRIGSLYFIYLFCTFRV